VTDEIYATALDVEEVAPRGALRALSVRPFRLLWVSTTLTATGFWFSTVALQVHVAHIRGTDPFALGLLYFVNLIPLLLFSPFAGVLIDRRNRQRIVVNTTRLLALLATTGAVLLELDHELAYPVVLALGFLLGTVLSTQGPTVQTLVNNSVPPSYLNSAISLNSIGNNVARIIGPAIAGPLLALSGPSASMAAYAVVAATASTLLRWLRVPNGVTVTRTPLTRGRFATGRHMAAGFRHVAERPPAGLALAMVAMTAAFGGSYVSMLPVLALKVYRGGPSTLSLLLMSSGVGAVFGAIGTGRRTEVSKISWIALRMLCLGLAVAGLATVRTATLAVPLCVAAGALNLTIMTSLNVLIQRLIDDALRGRVVSLFVVAWGGFLPVGALLLGALGSLLTPTRALTITSLNLAAASAAIFLFRRLRT
jgi:MFS family permease